MINVVSKGANTKIVIKYQFIITDREQTEDFVQNTSNQKWLMLNQNSANTKL
jgi:hypothetical protein